MIASPRAVNRIGVIGVGAMGLPVATRLMQSGFTVGVRDIRAERERLVASQGATAFASPLALAKWCDVLALFVPDHHDCGSVLFGDQGAAASLAGSKALMICSTVPPTFVESLAARLPMHTHLIDAPVSGGPARAERGELSLMLAARDEALASIQPVLQAMANRRFVISAKPGDGARMKLVNNMLAGINLAAGTEALAFAERLGLDLRTALDVINASSGESWIVADRMARALAGDETIAAPLRILTKDLRVLLETADTAGGQLPLAQLAHSKYQAAVDAGFSERDDSALLAYARLISSRNRPGSQ